MEENAGKDLAQDMKKELKETNLYYENVKLELSKIRLEDVIIEEKHKQEINENNEINELIEYGIYIEFKGENIKIATIDEAGTLIPNRDILQNEDKKYTDEELEALGDMLNRLGLEQDKVDLNKLKEQLKEIEAKTEDEYNKEKVTEEEKGKDDEEEKEEAEPEEEKDLAEVEAEAEQEVIAKRKHISPSNVCKIRRDSQFYKNYPNIPLTAYFYLDANDRIHAEYIDKDGSIKELPGFSEIKNRDEVTRLGNDGQDVKTDTPYRVMSAQGLEDKNNNTQEVRIALYKDSYGYLRIETIHQGRNGEWEGKNIDTYGRDRNTTKMNKVIDERYKTPKTGVIAKRQQELIDSGYSADGLSLDEMSKRRKINEYMQDGYTEEEAHSIYEYVVGEKQLSEQDAKVVVNEERAEKSEKESQGRTPGEDALERRYNRH